MLFKRKYDFTIANPDKLKGKIIIGYCRGHEAIIVFIKLVGYKEKYKHLLPTKFGYGKYI